MKRKFRGIKFSIEKTHLKNLEVLIDLDSIRYLVEEKYYDDAFSFVDYINKLQNLGSDIEDLGKKIYEENADIYFGYYHGITPMDAKQDLIGFGIYHKNYRNNSNFEYYKGFNTKMVERGWKINSLLDGDKSNKNP